MIYSIDEINQMSQEEFVNTFGNVFEETPAIAHQAWEYRPFTDVKHLHLQMLRIVNDMDQETQLVFIRAHPELGSNIKMADASVQEQTKAGLSQLTSEEYKYFQKLNKTYRDKFKFPFIIAVKEHTKDTILEAFHNRLDNSFDAEMQQALLEIAKITQLRLLALVK